MHAQTAHGAPGTENDVVTLPEEEAKIQKLRDRLNEVYNPIISRPDEEGEDGGNDDEDGTGEEAKDDNQDTIKDDQTNKSLVFNSSSDLNLGNNQSNQIDANQQNNTDVDMDTADEEEDVETADSEDVDTADSDMNDAMEDNKDNLKLHPVTTSLQNMNHQQNESSSSIHPSIPSQYPPQTLSQPITTISNHSTSGHHTPMLGNHEMVATSNSSQMSGQNSISQTQHGNTHLSHQPQIHLPNAVAPHDIQHGSNHHFLPSSQPHTQHPNIQHPGLSTHHNNQQHQASNNSIQPQMQSHLNSTGTHILDGNMMRPPKVEDANPLSSSMLDEFEQQMNQYQQQQH